MSEAEIDVIDKFRLSAAIGWLELGNWEEARAEAAKINPKLRMHPAVLDVRFGIATCARKWVVAEVIARILQNMRPSDPELWLKIALAVRYKESGGWGEAKEVLLEAHKLFPHDQNIAYRLACCFCQLGLFNNTRKWLDVAFALGDGKKLHMFMINDADMRPFLDGNPSTIV